MSRRYDTRAVLRSARMYEALVVALYPKRFHQAYAREMRLVFRQLCGDSHRRRGIGGLTHAWISELPALLAGAMRERNTAMARTVAAAGRVGTAKALMRANASALILFGVAVTFASTDLALGYGLVEQSDVPGPGAPDAAWSTLLPVKVMMQALGVALIGLGGLVFAAAAHMRQELGTGLPGALAGAHALLALPFAHALIQFSSDLAWATISVAAIFAVAYAAFWIVEAYAPTGHHSHGPSDVPERGQAQP